MIGQALRDSFVSRPRDTTVAANPWAGRDRGRRFQAGRHEFLAEYDGDSGHPVMMSRSQVGPGAHEPTSAAR